MNNASEHSNFCDEYFFLNVIRFNKSKYRDKILQIRVFRSYVLSTEELDTKIFLACERAL